MPSIVFKLIYVFNTVLIVCSAMSCSLSLEPTTFLTDSNYYKTSEEFDAATLHAYQVMTNLDYTRPYMNIPSVSSEETRPKEGEGLNINQFEEGTVDDSNQNLEQFFRLTYIGLNRANTVIEKLDGASINQDLKNQYQGENYFLRAWHHFMLVRIFGSVPLRLSPVDELSEVRGIQNASIEEIYSAVIADLNKAISLMKIERIDGRADKVVAQSLLSKVYLTMASSRFYGSPGYEWVSDANTYYELAKEWSNEVVNNQTIYTFDNDLQHIFDVSTSESYNGPEHIFFIGQNREGLEEGEFSKLSKFFIPADTPANSFTKDGTALHGGFNVYITELPFLSTFSQTDKRRTALIITELFAKVTDGATGVTPVWTPGGGESAPFSRKYIDSDYINDRTSTHPFLIRFTDILLVLAEAEGPTDIGYDAINKVRRRAGLVDLKQGLSVDEFRKAVIQERAFELAFEANRFYDLRRTNNIESVLRDQYKKNIDAAAYFYPIPRIEGELNQTN